MSEALERAKQQYKAVPPPQELSFAVASAIRAGTRRQGRRQALKRGLTSLAAVCACFVLLVNFSPSFARAVEQVPVLRDLAQVVTVARYTVEDRERLIDVRLPAVEHTGHTDLEQRINLEIKTRIDGVLAEAEERARETREAFLATGGEEADFMPILISVDYDVKCQNGHYLSFVLTKTETAANAYTELYCYNIDLETGRELTLADLLGPDWKGIADGAVRAGIAQRERDDPDAAYFDGSEGVPGFQGVEEGQRFYINAQGNPVVLFEKYDIAPGYMGIQEFEITG